MKGLLQTLRASLWSVGVDPNEVVKPKTDRQQIRDLRHRAWEDGRTRWLRECRERFDMESV